MRRSRLVGIIIAAVIGCGLVFGALSYQAIADQDEEIAEEEAVVLRNSIELDGFLYTASLSALDGLLSGDYISDRLMIRNAEDGEVLQDYYHIYDASKAEVLIVSLFTDEGFVYECVDDPEDGLLTLYKVAGPGENFRILDTESVSYADEARIAEIRALQGYLPEETEEAEAEESSDEESVEETVEETAESAEEAEETGDASLSEETEESVSDPSEEVTGPLTEEAQEESLPAQESVTEAQETSEEEAAASDLPAEESSDLSLPASEEAVPELQAQEAPEASASIG